MLMFFTSYILIYTNDSVGPNSQANHPQIISEIQGQFGKQKGRYPQTKIHIHPRLIIKKKTK